MLDYLAAENCDRSELLLQERIDYARQRIQQARKEIEASERLIEQLLAEQARLCHASLAHTMHLAAQALLGPAIPAIPLGDLAPADLPLDKIDQADLMALASDPISDEEIFAILNAGSDSPT